MDGETPTDALSRSQMETLVRDDTSRVETAQANLTAAHREYARVTARYNFESDEAHAVALRDFLPRLEAAEQRVTAVASAAERNAFEIRRQTGDIGMTLDPAERATAASVLPLLERDVEKLPLDRLATEVRAAIGRSDRPAMFIYGRLLPARLKGSDPRNDKPADAAARSEMGRMSLQINEALRDTSFDAVRKATDGVLEKAHALRSAAAKRRREGAPATTFKGEALVPWPQA